MEFEDFFPNYATQFIQEKSLLNDCHLSHICYSIPKAIQFIWIYIVPFNYIKIIIFMKLTPYTD